MVAVAVAVTYFTAGAATGLVGPVLGGAASGGLGGLASQAFGTVTNIQPGKINFKGVAMAALSGAVGAGVGQIGTIGKVGSGLANASAKVGNFLGNGRLVGDVVRGLAVNGATQGLAIAAGLQKKFDWTGLATAGAVSGAFGIMSRSISGQATGNPFSADGSRNLAVNADGVYNPAGYHGPSATNSMISGAVSGLAGGGVRSLITGTSFGDNILAVLPDVIGNVVGTIGARAASGVVERTVAAAKAKKDASGGATFTAGGGTGAADGFGYMADSAAAAEDEAIVVTGNGIRQLSPYAPIDYSKYMPEGGGAIPPAWQGVLANADGVNAHSMALMGAYAEKQRVKVEEGVHAKNKAAMMGQTITDTDVDYAEEPIVVNGDRKQMRAPQMTGKTSDYSKAYGSVPQYKYEVGAGYIKLFQNDGMEMDFPGYLRSNDNLGGAINNNSLAVNLILKSSPFQLRAVIMPVLNHHSKDGDMSAVAKQVQAYLDKLDADTSAVLQKDARDFGLIYGGTALGMASFFAAPAVGGYVASLGIEGAVGTGLYHGTMLTVGGGVGLAFERSKNALFGIRNTSGGDWGAVLTGGLGSSGLQIVRNGSNALNSTLLGGGSAFIGNGFGQNLNWIQGNGNLSFNDLVWNTGVGSIFGRIGAVSHFDLNISGFNSGRGSSAAIFAGLQRNVANGNIQRYQLQYPVSAGAGEVVRALPVNAAGTAYGTIYETNKRP